MRICFYSLSDISFDASNEKYKVVAMKLLKTVMTLALLIVMTTAKALTAYDFDLTSIDGQPLPLSQYRGKVIMIVNTASKCGFTPQFKALQKLNGQYKDQGLVIIGIPSKDFGDQEFSKSTEISSFASDNYAVTFPLTELSHVSGNKAHPIYKWAYSHLGSKAIPKWNFHKLLINRRGELITAFKTQISPDSPEVITAVEKAIDYSSKTRAEK